MTEASTTLTPGTVQFGPMQTEADAASFRALNEEWIVRWFRLEEPDRRTLNDPAGTIVAGGGQVYVAREAGKVVGCAALVAYGDRIFELAKMAVSPQMRGRGIGRRLLLYVLEQARQMGAQSVFLGSSTRLANAVHLYESVGFRHATVDQLPPLKYERADVFMTMTL